MELHSLDKGTLLTGIINHHLYDTKYYYNKYIGDLKLFHVEFDNYYQLHLNRDICKI